jgi:hypothetical protein
MSMSNELPLRVHLVPITGESIETTQWACPKCHWVWKDFDLAKACYSCCCIRKISAPEVARSFDYQDQTITELRNLTTGKPRYVSSTQDDLILSPEEINNIIKRTADLEI